MRCSRNSLISGFQSTVLLCATLAGAQSTPQRSLLALSKRNHTLAIVDPVSLQVIARVPVGPDPHEVIASSDGRPHTCPFMARALSHAVGD